MKIYKIKGEVQNPLKKNEAKLPSQMSSENFKINFMKKIICLFIFFNFSYILAQEESSFAPNHLIIRIKDDYFKIRKIDLTKNRFGITLLDKLNSELELKKVQSVGNYKKTKTFLLVFKNSINIQLAIKRYKQLKQLDFVFL